MRFNIKQMIFWVKQGNYLCCRIFSEISHPTKKYFHIQFYTSRWQPKQIIFRALIILM